MELQRVVGETAEHPLCQQRVVDGVLCGWCSTVFCVGTGGTLYKINFRCLPVPYILIQNNFYVFHCFLKVLSEIVTYNLLFPD
ncbi:MAG: hypothetical protein ACO1PI_07170 [Bacteroidota bacterium]